MHKRSGLAAVCAVLLFIAACASGETVEFREYNAMGGASESRARRADVERLGESLYKLKYIKNLIRHEDNNSTMSMPLRHYAALNLLAQVLGIPYEDGKISVAAQEALSQELAKAGADQAACPIAVPGYDNYTRQLFSKDCDVNSSVWCYAKIAELAETEDGYTISATAQSNGKEYAIDILYRMPEYAPQLLANDDVFVLGTLAAKDEKERRYTVQAELVTFSAAQ